MLGRTSTAAAAFVTALAFAAGPALAGQSASDSGSDSDMKSEVPAFEKADKDGSGAVTIEEARQAGVPESEAKAEDIDDDGKLSEADWGFIDMETGASQS